MNEEKETIGAIKEVLSTLHAVAQRERIRSRINELLAKGRTPDQIIASLKANPPVLYPKF